jgi:hypothetical protein
MRSWLAFWRFLFIAVFALPGALLLGSPTWAASSSAAKVTSGTLTVSGMFHGKWKLSSCLPLIPGNVNDDRTLSFGNGPGMSILGPIHGAKNINMATTKTVLIGLGYLIPPGSTTYTWGTGYEDSVTSSHATHTGSGTITDSAGLTSGKLDVKMVGIMGDGTNFPGIHVIVTWDNCPM